MYVCVYVSMYLFVYMRMCMHVCMCVCVYVYVCLLICSFSRYAHTYTQAAKDRMEAIHILLYNNTHSQWFDFNIQTHTHSPTGVISNFIPLWYVCICMYVCMYV